MRAFWNALRLSWDAYRRAFWNGLPDEAAWANFTLRLLAILLITSVTLFLARRVKGWVTQLLGRARIAANLIALTGNGVFIGIVLLGIAVLLIIFGANWTAVVASLSVVTVALGLALQDVLKNLIAGVYILLEQPFKICDRIDVKGISGEVQGIDIRTTILRTDEGIQVLVPNSVIFTEIVSNRSAYDIHRVALQLDEVRTPFQDLSRLVNDALAPFPDIEHAPAPKLTIQKVNDDGTTTTRIEYWQRGTTVILPEVLERLKEAFPGADITINAAATEPAAKTTPL